MIAIQVSCIASYISSSSSDLSANSQDIKFWAGAAVLTLSLNGTASVRWIEATEENSKVTSYEWDLLLFISW